eukprot:4063005-Pleurochrysis_carterae.AAC.1
MRHYSTAPASRASRRSPCASRAAGSGTQSGAHTAQTRNGSETARNAQAPDMPCNDGERTANIAFGGSTDGERARSNILQKPCDRVRSERFQRLRHDASVNAYACACT